MSLQRKKKTLIFFDIKTNKRKITKEKFIISDTKLFDLKVEKKKIIMENICIQ